MNPELIKQRKFVWLALLEFYTDPEPQETDYRRIANVMQIANLTYTEVVEINACEIAPVFMGSVMHVFYPSFMWGVEEEDFYAEILLRLSKQSPPTLLFSKRLWYWFVNLMIGRHLVKMKIYLA